MWGSSCLSTLLLVITHCAYADYIGAVVEYNPVSSSTPTLTIEENIKNYIYQIEQAKSFGVQLIVFPEYGLTRLIDDPVGWGLEVPNVGTSDLSNSSYFLLRLSDAAREHGLHVVVNLIEQANNTNNATIYYNSNLVFANNGTLIAKYRKINLVDEPKLTRGSEIVTFTTGFGTFGLMTCEDILYYNPSQTLLLNTSVTDVIYPAAWTSFYPFHVSLEVQVGYALSNNVNLLASNINNPSIGIGGSGIHNSDGTVLKRILTDSPATNIVFANVKPPSLVNRGFSLMGFDILRNDTVLEFANYKNLTDFQYNLYAFKSIDLSRENISEEICHEQFCCNFNISVLASEVNSSEVYKLVAYNGVAQYGSSQVRSQHCHLVACFNNDISTCGIRPLTPYRTIFRRLLVWGNFKKHPEAFYRPSSIGGNLHPIFNVTYLENRSDETYGVSFNLTQATNNLVAFGIYGRSGVEAVSVSLLLVAIVVAIQGIF